MFYFNRCGQLVEGDEPSTTKLIKRAAHVIAYTDGSYNDTTNTWGAGVVIYPKGREGSRIELSESGPDLYGSRNITGEAYAVLLAVRTIYQEFGCVELEVRHDYIGLAKWFDHEWGIKSMIARSYTESIDAYKDLLNISFRQVKAHSGDILNERADALARAAAGLKAR